MDLKKLLIIALFGLAYVACTKKEEAPAVAPTPPAPTAQENAAPGANPAVAPAPGQPAPGAPAPAPAAPQGEAPPTK